MELEFSGVQRGNEMSAEAMHLGVRHRHGVPIGGNFQLVSAAVVISRRPNALRIGLALQVAAADGVTCKGKSEIATRA